VRSACVYADEQVRAVAAQAYTSLVSPDEALKLITARPPDHTDLNAEHGQVLVVRHLISDVIDWSTVSATNQKYVEMLLILNIEQSAACFPIQSASIDCVEAYLEAADPSQEFRNRVMGYLKQPQDPSRAFPPGSSLLRETKARLKISDDESETSLSSLLCKSATEDEHLVALDTLLTATRAVSARIAVSILRLALSPTCGTAVQIAAFNVLGETFSLGTFGGLRSDILEEISHIATGHCVPLKEAALAALGWAVATVGTRRI
jgi:hypothetical protein